MTGYGVRDKIFYWKFLLGHALVTDMLSGIWGYHAIFVTENAVEVIGLGMGGI